MNKKLGFIENVEQFLDVDEDICSVDNSIKALEFFRSVGLDGDIVIAPCSIGFTDDDVDSFLLFWIAFDKTEKHNPSIVPAFKLDDTNILNELDISKIKSISDDCYFIFNEIFYCLVCTSTGNFVIKRVNGIWEEDNMKKYLKYKDPDLFHPQIFPVELFSKSKHRFITAVWAIEDNENERYTWFPINWDDFSLWKEFPASDIEMFPLNIGDVTRAGNVVFELKYSKNCGFFVEKTSKQLKDYHLAKDLRSLKPVEKTKVITFIPKYDNSKPQQPKGEAQTISLYPRKD